MHVTTEPPILYWGTPVTLVTTLSADGRPNIGPMSSAWWLGWTCLLGLDASSQTTDNLISTRECVLNMPSVDQLSMVERLAYSTAKDPMPAHKQWLGADYDPDKFGTSGFTAVPSLTVKPPRIEECPVQMEGVVENVYAIAEHDPGAAIPMRAVEIRITKIHVAETLLVDGENDRIDPTRWHPLIYSFRTYFGLGPQLAKSRQIDKAPEAVFLAAREATRAANVGNS